MKSLARVMVAVIGAAVVLLATAYALITDLPSRALDLIRRAPAVVLDLAADVPSFLILIAVLAILCIVTTVWGRR